MLYLLKIELHAYTTIRAYAFLGEENAYKYGANEGQCSIALLHDENGYHAALTHLKPTIQGGRLLETKEVTETFRLYYGIPVEVSWQYAGGGVGYQYIDLSATLTLISEKAREIKKLLKGEDHFFLASFYQAKAKHELALANAEVQARIAYNKSHSNYSGMDPDVMKDYMTGGDKKD